MLSSTLAVLGVLISICLICPYYLSGLNMFKCIGICIVFFILSVFYTLITVASIPSRISAQSKNSGWNTNDIDSY